jgi:Ca-activated chloride channel homolog
MSDFHFLRPAWFLALPPMLGLLWLLWQRRLRSRSWQEICDPQLLPHLLLGRSRRRANWPLWLLLAGLLLALTALAGPTWQKQPQPLLRRQSALVILLDLSRSMHAGDLKPSRLERARLKVADILRQRREGQAALVAFAGDAFVVTPLTDDTRTIELLLGSLDPELMPVQGSAPARALELGAELLQRAGLKQGTLLLVTDEDRPQAAEAAARKLKKQGLQLEVLGVGTPEGAPIPLAGGGFFKDAQGSLVLPKLDEPGLRRLAAAGGGRYRRLSIDDSDFSDLLSALDSHRLDRAEPDATRLGDRWQEAGIWLLWPLALLAAGAFRRGWLAVFALLLVLPRPAAALSWQELWQRPDQQAHSAFQAGAYQAAGERFENPRWKASALYRAGRFAEALKAQPKAHSADDWYNRGNALARAGQLPAALKAYDQALKLQPDDADTQTNRQLVEQALQQQKQQQQDQADQQQRDSDQKQPAGEPKAQTGQKSESKEQGSQDAAAKPQEKSSQQQAGDQGEQNPPPGQAAGQDQQPKDPSAQGASEQTRQQSDDQSAQANATQPDQTAEPSQQPAQAASATDEAPPPDAAQRELQQWLQRIPDDPGGLLRRKFLYQYRQRGQQLETDRPW